MYEFLLTIKPETTGLKRFLDIGSPCFDTSIFISTMFFLTIDHRQPPGNISAWEFILMVALLSQSFNSFSSASMSLSISLRSAEFKFFRTDESLGPGIAEKQGIPHSIGEASINSFPRKELLASSFDTTLSRESLP